MACMALPTLSFATTLFRGNAFRREGEGRALAVNLWEVTGVIAMRQSALVVNFMMTGGGVEDLERVLIRFWKI